MRIKSSIFGNLLYTIFNIFILGKFHINVVNWAKIKHYNIEHELHESQNHYVSIEVETANAIRKSRQKHSQY